MASRLEVTPSQILLLRGDEELDIKETPQSLNLTVADIIGKLPLYQCRHRKMATAAVLYHLCAGDDCRARDVSAPEIRGGGGGGCDCRHC